MQTMKIFVTAKPNAKEERVERIDATHFRVSVKEPPVQGRANHAIAAALAKHLGVPRSAVILVAGFTWKEKVFEIR